MRVHLSLGANLGDPRGQIRAALDALDALESVRVCRCSSYYETAPLGHTDQPVFVNMAAEIETELSPLEFLNAVKAIEAGLGRTETFLWGPRMIDIDLILWGAEVVRTPRLRIPHAEFRGRAFVLIPLAEIAPDAVDPETGATVAELAARPEAEGAVCKMQCLTP